MTVTCTMIEALLMQYESLSDQDRDVIAAHIADCPACRGSLDLIQAFGDMLRDEAEAAMPADLTDRVMGAIRAEPRAAPDNRPLVFMIVLLITQVALLLYSSGRPPVGIEGLYALGESVSVFGSAFLVGFVDGVSSISAAFDTAFGSMVWLTRPDTVAVSVVVAVLMCGALLLRDTQMKGHDHA